MKKIILTATVIATTLVSCSNNEIDQVVDSTGNNPISFTNLNDKLSRSANDAKDNYKVYAKSSLSNENAWFIDDAIKDADNKPASGKSYYWPASPATVAFYAWAPSSVTATSSTYPSLSITYSVPAGANQDFTVAAPVKSQSSGTVAFLFSHMLSKISVTAKLADGLTQSGYGISFTSASLVVKSNGATVDPTTADSPAWGTPNATEATYSGAKSYMIMPQTSTGCTVQLKGVTITKGGATVFSGDMKIYSIAADDVKPDNKFAKGSHYSLNITVDSGANDGSGNPVFGNEIKFSAGLAADWNTPATNNPLDQN